MPVALSEYIRRSRSVLDEPSSRFWTDAELTDWINDGARDLARRAEDLLTYDQTITITPSIAVYTHPPCRVRTQRLDPNVPHPSVVARRNGPSVGDIPSEPCLLSVVDGDPRLPWRLWCVGVPNPVLPCPRPSRDDQPLLLQDATTAPVHGNDSHDRPARRMGRPHPPIRRMAGATQNERPAVAGSVPALQREP